MNTDKARTNKAEDRFQRYEFSKRVATIVASPKIDKSLVVGIYGKWGEGKTTVMNFIREELPEDTVAINFNPWLFSDQQSLLKYFFDTLITSLKASKYTNKEKLGKILADYGGAVGMITQFFGMSTSTLEEAGKKLKTVSVEDIKKRVDQLIIESEKNIVVFVDDIDRLDVDEVQYVFKLIKLVGDFPRTCYILSFDDDMVASALAPKYGSVNASSGYQFLEKIIQIPLKLPKAEKKALSKYGLDLIDQALNENQLTLSKNDSAHFLEAFNTAFLPQMYTPRAGIRYANTLSVSLPLLIGEVNFADLMIIEGMKVFYPHLYDFVRNEGRLLIQRIGNDGHYDFVHGNKIEIKNKVDNSISRYGELEKRRLIDLLQHIFPQLKAVYSNSNFSDKSYADWAKEKKICSGKYFDRYFTYSIQEGEMPDTYLESIVKNLENQTYEDAKLKIRAALKEYSAFDLIQGLRMYEAELNENQAMKLIMTIASLGSHFPQENDFHFATTFAQSANLITRLVLQISRNERSKVVTQILQESQSLSYAMEVQHWIMVRNKKSSEDILVTEDGEKAMQEKIVNRFLKEYSDKTFFLIVSDPNLWKILVWGTSFKEKNAKIKSFLSEQLRTKKNTWFALRLLKVFSTEITSTALGSYETVTYKTGFQKYGFEDISKVVDVKLLNENLLKDYGMNPSNADPETLSDRDKVDDKSLVSMFQWFVNKPQ